MVDLQLEVARLERLLRAHVLAGRSVAQDLIDVAEALGCPLEDQDDPEKILARARAVAIAAAIASKECFDAY